MSVGRLISYILQVVLTHLNNTYNYGQYAYAMSIVTTVAVFASLGFNNSVIRFVPEYFKLCKYRELHGFLRTALTTTLLGGCSLGLVSFVILAVLQHGFYLETAALFGLTVPLIALIQYYSELARSLGSVTASIVPGSLIQPVSTLVIISVCYMVTGTSNVTIIALSVTASCVITLIGFKAIIFKKSRLWLRYAPSYSVKAWTSISSTMMLMVGFQAILGQFDVIIVGSVLDPSATGFYNIGTKIATLANFALLAVNQVFAPTIALIHSDGAKQRLQRELSKAAVLTFVPTLVIGLVLYVGSTPLLKIFGPEFTHAEGVLHILIIGQIVNAATGPVGYVLNLTGHHQVSTRIYGVSSLVNVVGCYLAAKIGGTVDAIAWVSMGSMILWNVWMHISVVRRLGVWPSILGAIRSTRSPSNETIL